MFKTLLGFVGLGGVSAGGWLAVGLSVASAFTGGLWTHARFDKADLADMYAQHNQQLRDAVQRTIDQAKQRQADNDEVLAAAIEAERSAATDYATAVRGIKDAKPAECSDRHLPDDRRRMLDLARTGDPGTAAAVPPATGPPAGKAQAPAAPVTYEDEQIAHAGCGRQYRELMGRYNALIDWFEKQEDKP